MLVLADLSQALREEERLAWQRLLRVLGHELNNSLAPIKSISDSLASLLDKEPLPDDWREDARAAWGSQRAGGGAEPVHGSLLAPRPLAATKNGARQSGGHDPPGGGLGDAAPGHVDPRTGPDRSGGRDQLEQLLINLVRNAGDAALETKGGVNIRWAKAGAQWEVCIEDEGPGLSNTANLFVPFFTTKPGGSGIGLVISRQIAEAHGGSLLIENRKDRSGCIARLRLPLG